MKTCTKCGIEKPLSEYYKDSRAKGGLQSRCKSCKSKYAAKWNSENQGYKANWDSANKKHISEYKAKYRSENKENIAEYQTKYRSENKNNTAKTNAKYYSENKERIAQNVRNWRKTNPDKVCSNNAKRRAAKLNAMTDTSCIKAIASIYRNCPEGYHVDHIVPLNKKGKHHQDNLCYLPAALNLAKSDKLLEDYPELLKQFNEQVVYPNKQA